MGLEQIYVKFAVAFLPQLVGQDPQALVVPAPAIVVGPSALSIQSVAVAVPPLSFVTFFTSVRLGAVSSFVIEQVVD